MGYYLGEVQQGAIVLDPPVVLPEGAKVRVIVEPTEDGRDVQRPTLYERLHHLDGVIDDLPADFAAQHDHYIHGTPKRDV